MHLLRPVFIQNLTIKIFFIVDIFSS